MTLGPWTARALASVVAAVALVVSSACAAQEPPSEKPTSAPAAQGSTAPSAQPQPQPDQPASQPQAKKPQPLPQERELRIERVHTPDGVVTVTYAPKATAKDLGVPAFRGAAEKQSAVWRMKPPKGDEWVLAIAELTSTASVESLERFYHQALGEPDVRRSEADEQVLVVLSRVEGPAALVVRLTRAADAKETTVLIRRAVQGAPVILEPAGTPPAPRRGAPRSGQPQVVPIQAD